MMLTVKSASCHGSKAILYLLSLCKLHFKKLSSFIHPCNCSLGVLKELQSPFSLRTDVKMVIATLGICLLSLVWNWSPASLWKAQFSPWTVRSSHPFRNIGYLLCRLVVTATNLLVHKPAMCLWMACHYCIWVVRRMGYSLIMCCQLSTIWWSLKWTPRTLLCEFNTVQYFSRSGGSSLRNKSTSFLTSRCPWALGGIVV